MAVLRGIMKHLLAADDQNPGTVIDHAFIAEYTAGYDAFLNTIRNTNWADIEQMSGLPREQLWEAADLIAPKQKIITCWAMGLTQQKNGVMSIQEIVNLHLIKGAVGKPGAGTCPVRGHSIVQGDRTMGIWERPHKEFLDSLQKEFNFEPPREHGLDTVEAIKAMYEGKTKVFVSLGGNFLSASPDTEFVAEGMRKHSLTAFISTKLNRGHLVTGRTSLILPCLTHVDVDRQQRQLEKFIAIPYDIPEGNTAAYYPEANPLVPVSSVAYISNTPTSKFVVITVEPVLTTNFEVGVCHGVGRLRRAVIPSHQ